jgi:hypothetical protein
MAALILGVIVFGRLVDRCGKAEVDEVALPDDELKYMIHKRKNDLFELGFWNELPHGRAMRDKKSPFEEEARPARLGVRQTHEVDLSDKRPFILHFDADCFRLTLGVKAKLCRDSIVDVRCGAPF